MEKLFGCGISARLPSDFAALHRVVTLGQPLGSEGELGKVIEAVARKLAGASKQKPEEGARDLKPALSGA
jgi:hypothetical protein